MASTQSEEAHLQTENPESSASIGNDLGKLDSEEFGHASEVFLRQTQVRSQVLACPYRTAEMQLCIRPFSCNGLAAKSMAEVRKHLKRSGHVKFIKLCQTCNEDILDEAIFEREHGQYCQLPARQQRRGAQQRQWEALYQRLDTRLGGETHPAHMATKGNLKDAATQTESWMLQPQSTLQSNRERPTLKLVTTDGWLENAFAIATCTGGLSLQQEAEIMNAVRRVLKLSSAQPETSTRPYPLQSAGPLSSGDVTRDDLRRVQPSQLDAPPPIVTEPTTTFNPPETSKALKAPSELAPKEADDMEIEQIVEVVELSHDGRPSDLAQCSKCKETFSGRFRKGNLARHMRLRHTHRRELFACTQCEKTFSRRDNLLKHVRRNHGSDS